jgi:hypothetical protein
VLKLLEEGVLSWEDDPVLPVEVRPVRDVPHRPVSASANAACQNGGVIAAGYASDVSPDVDFPDGTAAPVVDIDREEGSGSCSCGPGDHDLGHIRGLGGGELAGLLPVRVSHRLAEALAGKGVIPLAP